MGHDQRFKEFLQVFLQELLKLFYPDVEQRLDFGRIEFLDKDVFTDLTSSFPKRRRKLPAADFQKGVSKTCRMWS